MCGIALSQLGLKPGEFYELTPVEFYYAIEDRKATISNMAKLDDSRFQLLSNVIRLSTWYLTNVQLPRKYRVRKPNKLMKFYWDKPTGLTAQTPEEMRKLMKLMAATSKRIAEERGKLREARRKMKEERNKKN